MTPEEANKLRKRRAELVQETARLDALLLSYAKTAIASGSVPASTRPVLSPIQHYTVVDREQYVCGCDICLDWERRREEFLSVASMVPKGHKWSTCGCDTCRFVAAVHRGYQASRNVLDLVSGVAFHAEHHSKHGMVVMDWLYQELNSPICTEAWKAHEIGVYPLSWWLQQAETTLSPTVSGRVFHLE